MDLNIPLKNAKREHFAQLVSTGENATRAYVTAGYSPNGAAQSANQLLRKTEVSSRISYLRSVIQEKQEVATEVVIQKAALDKAWVIAQLMENVSMAKSAEPVLDAEGQPTGEYRQNLNAANKALELLGKEVGMFVDRKEIRTGPLDGLPPDEARALLEAIDAIQHARTATTLPGSAAKTA